MEDGKILDTNFINNILNCRRCKLSAFRSHVVIGRGDFTSARFLLIGEGPGVSEDVLASAFVGEAGKLLDEILIRSGIDTTVCFFTNVVLCRPCNFRNDINRAPMNDEAFACLHNIMQIIGAMRKVEKVIFVGKIAESYYKRRLQGFDKISIALLKGGGRAHPGYQDAINTLSDFISKGARIRESGRGIYPGKGGNGVGNFEPLK